MAIDAHIHLQDFPKFIGREAFNSALKQRQVFPIIVGYSHASNVAAYELASTHNLPYVLGIAPQTVVDEGLENFEEWLNFVSAKKPSAIGEIGLDYKWADTDERKKQQLKAFEVQMALAERLSLPIVLHCRRCCDDLVTTIKDFGFYGRIMFHSFSCKVKHVEALADNRPLISLNTWKSKEKKKAIQHFGIERFTTETDAPYIAKSPLEVKAVIEEIASIKGLPEKEVELKTTENAARFFKLGDDYRGYSLF